KNADTAWGPIGDHRISIQSERYHVQLNAGTVSLTSGLKTVSGAGTQFTRLSEGWKIKVGAQTLVIETITSDTSMTVTTASSSTFTSAYTVVIVIPIAPSIKVNPSNTYNLKLTLRARGTAGVSVTTITATFTTDADGNVVTDVNPPSGLGTPSLRWTAEGKLEIAGMSAATDINTLHDFWVVITDNGGVPKYYDFVANAAAGSETAARLKIGLNRRYTFPHSKLKRLINVFGA